MFKVLYFKELLEDILNYRFVIALVLGLTIVPISFYFNAKDYEAKEQYYREAVRLYEQSHKTIRETTSEGAAILRPPSPLSMISSGLEFVLPNEVASSPIAAQIQFKSNRNLDSPFLFLFGQIDLTFIVSIIMSLLTMLLAYNQVAGERESRTLNQILSNSVPRNLVILAKMAASATLIGTIYLLGVLLGLIVLIFIGYEVLGNGSTILRLVLSFGSSFLYILVFTLFCLFISTLNKRSISAIVSTMFCWVVLFMIVPKASVVISKILRPVESQEGIIFKKERIRAQYEKEKYDEIQKLQVSMPGVKDLTSIEYFEKLRAGDKNAKDYDAKQRELTQLYDTVCEIEIAKVDSRYEARLSAQAALAQALSRLSPISCFSHIMIEISNTGFAEYEQLKLARSRLKHVLDTEIYGKYESTIFKGVAVTINRGENLDSPMPRIEYVSTPLRKAIASIWPDFILLCVYGFLFFAGSYVAFIRYDVR